MKLLHIFRYSPLLLVMGLNTPAIAQDCFSRLVANIQDDYRAYYPSQSLFYVGGLVGISAALAYSRIDQDMRQWWQEDVRSSFTHELARSSLSNIREEGAILIPLYAVAYCVAEDWLPAPFNYKVRDWAGNTLQALALGVPQQIFLTHAMGGQRPTEGNSHWHPFKKGHNRGISGHAFYGALPFLNAAKITEHPIGKIGWYFVSALPGWGRIEKDKHYFSQVVAGFGLAYIMTEFVTNRTPTQTSLWSVYPNRGGATLQFQHSF